MAQLIAQHESETDSTNRSYGLEIFHDRDEDFYTVRFHIRTYVMLEVTDKWATPEVRLDASSGVAARREAMAKLQAFRDILNPVGA